MDVREKLVELLKRTDREVYEALKDREDYMEEMLWDYFASNLIANGVTVQEWISVKDRLPEEKSNYIVHYKHAYCNNDGYWAIGSCFYDGSKFQMDWAYTVTHWMPLPEPPKGE